MGEETSRDGRLIIENGIICCNTRNDRACSKVLVYEYHKPKNHHLVCMGYILIIQNRL